MKIDPKTYPTLATYQPEQIEEAVKSLLSKKLADNETQALNNLELDLQMEKEQATGNQ